MHWKSYSLICVLMMRIPDKRASSLNGKSWDIIGSKIIIIKKRRDFFSRTVEKPLRLFEKKYNLVGKSGYRYDLSHKHLIWNSQQWDDYLKLQLFHL